MILTATEEHSGERIDSFISSMTDLSRTAVAKLCDEGSVAINGRACQKKDKIKAGDEISFELPEPEEYDVLPEDIPIDVVYEDTSIIVINKPSGMVVHPAAGNESGTLVNALLYHCGDSLSGINGVIRPGIVHRIDKDTSGLLVVAKNDFSHVSLAEQISSHTFDRFYRARSHGKNGRRCVS